MCSHTVTFGVAHILLHISRNTQVLLLYLAEIDSPVILVLQIPRKTGNA